MCIRDRTTAEQQAKSIIYMDDPVKQEQYKQMAQTNIRFLLEGETPVSYTHLDVYKRQLVSLMTRAQR